MGELIVSNRICVCSETFETLWTLKPIHKVTMNMYMHNIVFVWTCQVVSIICYYNIECLQLGAHGWRTPFIHYVRVHNLLACAHYAYKDNERESFGLCELPNERMLTQSTQAIAHNSTEQSNRKWTPTTSVRQTDSCLRQWTSQK